MYFKSRVDAGIQIAQKLEKYRYENTATIALSDGGVIVGAQVAMKLHCVLTMLLTEQIELPGESDPISVIDQEGGFTYNNMFSAGQLEADINEFHNYIDEKAREKFHKINQLLGDGGLIKPELLKDHIVILVSDGLSNGLSLDAAFGYLKPIRLNKLVIATPFASVPAVDRMHLLADEIICLNVLENYMHTNHYYEDNEMPTHENIVKTIEEIVFNWR